MAAAANKARVVDWAAEEDFEKHRALITRLYSTENQTLNQVVEVMERDHGFHATHRMYKNRFKRWGLKKYTKASSAGENVRVKKEEQEDKPGPVTHNALISRAKGGGNGPLVKASEKRKRPQPTKALLSSTVRKPALAPAPSPTFSFAPRLYTGISSPFVQEESTYHDLKRYYDASFSSFSTWTQTSPSTDVVQLKPGLTQIRDDLQDLHSRFRIAMNKITTQTPSPSDRADGIRILRVCFARLPMVLAAEDPLLINHVLDIIRRLQDAGQDFLEAQFKRHIAWLAQTPGQPYSTSLLWRILMNGIPLDRYHRSLFTQLAVDAFQQHLGKWHFETLQVWMWLLFNREDNAFLRGYGLRELYAQLEAAVGKEVFDDRHLDILMNLASHHLRSEEPEEAVGVVNSVLLDPTRQSVLEAHLGIAYNFYWLIGKALGKQGNHTQAEGYLREALEVARRQMGHDDADDAAYLSAMTALELNLRDQGRMNDADDMLEKRQAYIRQSLEKVGETEDQR
ncbi:hypothetical protein SCAR479_03360 [Seiridium cardinale]|uniref:Clr5 domain-containing protein n=1 Tax=Seiridium cardinale TaxID=138064 RepID=A0ABR2Y108_9PEZI